MSQTTTQVNGRTTTAANEELLTLMRRIAIASERTSRRVGVIEWLMLAPVVMTVAILVLMFMYR